MIAWVDLETTGLVATKERVLEVACIVTDDALNEVARFQRVTNEARYVDFSKVDPYVIEMHFTNGLWRESLLKGDIYLASLACVDVELAKFIHEHGWRTVPMRDKEGNIVGETLDKPQLAGSTISFDRAFMNVHFPYASKELHYRNVDVSSFNEIARRTWSTVYEARPRPTGTAHRAMDDIVDSLAVMRHYINNLGPQVFAGEGNPTS